MLYVRHVYTYVDFFSLTLSFRTTVPFGGETTWNLSSSSPKREGRVKPLFLPLGTQHTQCPLVPILHGAVERGMQALWILNSKLRHILQIVSTFLCSNQSRQCNGMSTYDTTININNCWCCCTLSFPMGIMIRPQVPVS